MLSTAMLRTYIAAIAFVISNIYKVSCGATLLTISKGPKGALRRDQTNHPAAGQRIRTELL